MQMYFEVSSKDCFNKIKQSLEGQSLFFKSLDALEKKYKAKTSLIFHSLQTGLKFSCLWYDENQIGDIDSSIFKIT